MYFKQAKLSGFLKLIYPALSHNSDFLINHERYTNSLIAMKIQKTAFLEVGTETVAVFTCLWKPLRYI